MRGNGSLSPVVRGGLLALLAGGVILALDQGFQGGVQLMGLLP